MNNHPQGIQRNSTVIVFPINENPELALVLSADNIGMTVAVNKPLESTFEQLTTEVKENIVVSFYPWTSVDKVNIVGGRN
jgi:hypothetical protein